MIEILNGIVETVAYGSVSGFKVYHNIEPVDYPIHWHTAVEIIMPLAGGYKVEIGGISTTIGDGEIFVIPPGELHSLFAPPDGERLIILFDYSLICNLNGMDSLLHMLRPFKLITKDDFPDTIDKLCCCLNEMEDEYTSGRQYNAAYIYALLIRFFVTLGRSSMSVDSRFPHITTNKQHEYVEKFMLVCNYINDHCSEDITVDELAGIAGFSRFHFARLFKQFTNISYYDYLTQKRIAHAERLLIIPDMSITDVAMQSGFNSLSTFNRTFKAAKKCTPSEYKGLNNPQQFESCRSSGGA